MFSSFLAPWTARPSHYSREHRDWACIPQSWDSGGAVDPKRNPQVIGSLPDAHKTITSEEVAKQFYIYTLAKKGVIWLWDIEWFPTLDVSSSAIQKMLDGGQVGSNPTTLTAAVAVATASVQRFRHMKDEDNWYDYDHAPPRLARPSPSLAN